MNFRAVTDHEVERGVPVEDVAAVKCYGDGGGGGGLHELRPPAGGNDGDNIGRRRGKRGGARDGGSSACLQPGEERKGERLGNDAGKKREMDREKRPNTRR